MLIDGEGFGGSGYWRGVNMRQGLSPRVINGRWTRMDLPRRSARVAVMQDDPQVQARVDWSLGTPQGRRR